MSEENRCPRCGWPFAESAEKGCVPGDCSYRPRQYSDEWYRIKRREAELQAEQHGYDPIYLGA